jgi:TonB family protein
VLLSIEVDPSGQAIDVRLVRSLGRGLDEVMIAAVKKCLFMQGMHNGGPVTAAARIEVRFRL